MNKILQKKIVLVGGTLLGMLLFFPGLALGVNNPPVISAGWTVANFEIGAFAPFPFTEELAKSTATVFDVEDGDITSQIQVSGVASVDTSVAGTYYVTLTVIDSGGLSDSLLREINVRNLGATTPGRCYENGNLSDRYTKCPPEITLLGSNPLIIEQGSVFTDSGATATDFEDGNLTAQIVVTGAVNTALLGTYTLNYFVQDSDGETDATTRAVQVVAPPNQPPTITLVGDNPMTVLLNVTFTDPGATASDPEDGDITANIVKGGSVNIAAEGTYTLTYDVGDSKGLAAIQKTRTVKVQGPVPPPPVPPPPTPPPVIPPYYPPVVPPAPPQPPATTTPPVLPPPTPPPVIPEPQVCNYLLEYLKIDKANNPLEVIKLQSFLKNYEGFSDLQINGVFDTATDAAVRLFQEKYQSDVLAPWGLAGPTGYVYITTKKKINEIYCQEPFPLTFAQEQEIAEYRDWIESLAEAPAPSPEPAPDLESKEVGQAEPESEETATNSTLAGLKGAENNQTATSDVYINEQGLASIASNVNCPVCEAQEPKTNLAIAGLSGLVGMSNWLLLLIIQVAMLGLLAAALILAIKSKSAQVTPDEGRIVFSG